MPTAHSGPKCSNGEDFKAQKIQTFYREHVCRLLLLWWFYLVSVFRGQQQHSSRIRKKVSSKQWVIFYASGQFLKSCASWVENMSSLWASPLQEMLKMKWPNLQTDLYVSGTATQSFECYPQEKSKASSKKYNLPEIGIKVFRNHTRFS